MKKLIVLSTWSKPIEQTWSGTTFALTQALKKYYDVEIKDVQEFFILKFIRRLCRFPIIGSLFGSLYTKLLEYKANYVIGKDKSTPVLEIGRCFKIHNPYFTYEDLSWECGEFVKKQKKTYPFIFEAAGNNSFSQKEYKRRIQHQKEIYSKAKAILFMSQWVSEFTKKKNPSISEKISFVGGGANIDLSGIDLSKKKGNKFLFVGRDFQRKAGDLVVEAFKIIQKKYLEKVELHIAGPQDLNIHEQNIITHGDADLQAVNKLMNECDVFVMPSRFEAYGLVFAEALIHGMPCIARNLFEMPYFIQNGVNGFLILEDNPEKLAEMMMSTIKSKDMINAVKDNHLEYLKKYSWDTVAEKISVIINQHMGYN